MTTEKLNEIFTSDFNVDNVVAAQQMWSSEQRFSRIDRPRSRQGLFLLTDYPARYELVDGTTFTANPGDLLLLPKGARYMTTFLSPPGKQSHPLMINFRLTDTEGREVALGELPMRLCRDNGNFLPYFTAAIQLYINTAPTKLKAKVYELLGNLFPLADTDECCLTYIGNHYTDDLSVPKLAQRCAISETVYRKRFRQLTGMSPVRYINRLKVDKACQMLQSGDISTAQICEFLNFYSLPYFYKVFKEYTGLTPHQYRDQSAQNMP